MARPKKQGLDYFPFDVNFFSDKKIKIVKARFSNDGVMIYLYLLCEIYKNGYFIVWDADYKFIIADELNISDGLIEQVLKFLIERSLLQSILLNSDTIITSPSIQRRFQEIVKTRKTPTSVLSELWLLSKEETQGCIKVTQKQGFSENNPCFSEKNPDNSEINATKESKGKESKAKESRVKKKRLRFPLSAYGTFKNVLLSEEEIAKLKGKYPNSYQAKIERLSVYLESKGTHYSNHFAKLIEWLEKDGDEEKAIIRNHTASYDIDELEKITSLDDS